jgi:hypothetical protein
MIAIAGITVVGFGVAYFRRKNANVAKHLQSDKDRIAGNQVVEDSTSRFVEDRKHDVENKKISKTNSFVFDHIIFSIRNNSTHLLPVLFLIHDNDYGFFPGDAEKLNLNKVRSSSMSFFVYLSK